MIVNIPSPLRSYTQNAGQVAGTGASVQEVLADLDARYPGLKFRIIDEQDGIRKHIKIFVNCEQVHNLSAFVGSDDAVHIICALSGG